MSSFDHFQAAQKLRKLAERPIDLTYAFSAERVRRYQLNKEGFTLYFGTERIDDDVLDSLCTLALEARAIEKMQAMQSGAIVNQVEGYESERRSVLHTAMRDVFDHPVDAFEAKRAAQGATEELHKLKKLRFQIPKSAESKGKF